MAVWFAWDADTTPPGAIVAAVERFRHACRPSAKIVLLLVQRGGAAATGAFGPLSSPNNKDDERLVGLRKAADLDARTLLTLMHVEGDGNDARFEEGSVRRVERQLLELALNYYKDESRKNKKVRALGGKSAPPHLVARHHFKRAYFSEVRRDAANASKHWTACSGALRDVLRMVAAPGVAQGAEDASGVRLGEVKRVAEFVNRKILVAAFASLRAAEACDAFRRHVRLFRTLIHTGGLTGAAHWAAGHVHWGWLCKQYRSFARSLESAATVGGAPGGSSAAARLGASGVHAQYAECGYYYQSAASCALERRKCAEKLVAALTAASGPPPTAGAAPAAAPAAVTLTLPSTLVIDGVPANDLASELGVGVEVSVAADSGLVIELLTRAYEHFKRSRQLRMILFLASQMAEEYFYAHNFEMAKRFFERVAKTYQKERWYSVLAHIQRSLRVCAQQLSLIAEFVASSISLLSARLSSLQMARPHPTTSTHPIQPATHQPLVGG